MESKRKHSGYDIIQALSVSPTMEIVLGENLSSRTAPYIVWTCLNGTEYRWGHPCTSYVKALAEFGNGISANAQAYDQQLAQKGCKNNQKNFFDKDDCITDNTDSIYKDRVIVVDPTYMKREYRHPSQQLYLATGCTSRCAEAKGQAVYATSLADGTSIHWERHQIIGILKAECMPAWARRSLTKLNRLMPKGRAEDADR